MAVPRNRSSRHAQRIRRSHHAKKPCHSQKCTHCGADALPHRTCLACGHYGDRMVLNSAEKSDGKILGRARKLRNIS